MIDVHARMIRDLEQHRRAQPGDRVPAGPQAINDRKVARLGLTSPELAVVMAYCKINLYAELLDSDLPEDPYLAHDLERYFPPPLPERYSERMRGHRLRREIIATVVANQLVDRAGTTFVFRLGEETGAPPSLLARAFAVAREVYDMREFWAEVEELDNDVEAMTLLTMLIDGAAARRARDALAGALQPELDRHRAVGRAVPAWRAVTLEGASRHARSDRPR